MEQLARALGTHYGLKVLEARRIDFGIWEEPFAVQTDQGRFYAKRFRRKDRPTARMLRGLETCERVRRMGFPAPRVVPTLSGDLLAIYGDERYQVTEWVEGRSYHPGDLPAEAVAPMGALLGRLHRLLGPAPQPAAAPLPSPGEGVRRCRALLEQYEYRPEPFAAVAREVLEEQIGLLSALPPDFHERLPRPRLGGPVFNSFWVEQLLFKPDGSVAALVDWTDGAGREGHWVDDLDLGAHLGALPLDQVITYAAGYQYEHPLPESEWRAFAASLCYGHLASTNFLAGWLDRPYRRMADWEITAARWHQLVCPRFRAWAGLEEALLEATRT